jgi:hypothetical protein
VLKDGLAEWVYFAMKDVIPSNRFGGEVKAPATGKKTSVVQWSPVGKMGELGGNLRL